MAYLQAREKKTSCIHGPIKQWRIYVMASGSADPDDLALTSSTLRSFTAYDPGKKYSRPWQPDSPSNDKLMIKSKTHAAGPVVVQFDPLLLWSLRLSNAPSRPCLSPALSCSDVVLAFSASRVCAPSFGSVNARGGLDFWRKMLNRKQKATEAVSGMFFLKEKYLSYSYLFIACILKRQKSRV